MFEDEEAIDEYKERYNENEDQSDMPGDPALDEYFNNNPNDLRYFTYFRRYSDWPKQIDDYAHIFKDRYGVFPNVLIMNRITEGRLEDAFYEVIAKDMDPEEKEKLAVKLGVERGDNFDECDDVWESQISSDAYFSTEEYRLLLLECSTFGSGVMEFIRAHDFLADDPVYTDGCKVSSRDKENTDVPVIDMDKTAENLKRIMAEEDVTPKIISRITGHSLQAVYDWLAGKKMPNLDNLMLLGRLLNRPIEELIVTHNREK